MSANRILITGAGGYLGERTARRLLDTTDHEVVLWLHAADEAEARTKIEPLARGFESYGKRVSFAHGELGADEPFAMVDPRTLRGLIHGAAVTKFSVDAETADRVNVDGSEKAFRFAERCDGLDQLTYVSTVYASGLREGAVTEQPFDAVAGFANHYERSKNAAEHILITRFDHLPWRIARVATVIADDETGKVTQYNAVHNTLKLFYYGLISLVPGLADTPLYFVTGDFVVKALADVWACSERHAIYHLAHTRAESLNLDQLVDKAFEVFQENDAFRARRVLKPMYVDASSFDMLVDGIDGFGGDVLKDALRSVSPFARQLFVNKDLENGRLRAAITAYAAPYMDKLVRATCEHLVRTKWGKVS
jgi:thioester reductase-like protein